MESTRVPVEPTFEANNVINETIRHEEVPTYHVMSSSIPSTSNQNIPSTSTPAQQFFQHMDPATAEAMFLKLGGGAFTPYQRPQQVVYQEKMQNGYTSATGGYVSESHPPMSYAGAIPAPVPSTAESSSSARYVYEPQALDPQAPGARTSVDNFPDNQAHVAHLPVQPPGFAGETEKVTGYASETRGIVGGLPSNGLLPIAPQIATTSKVATKKRVFKDESKAVDGRTKKARDVPIETNNNYGGNATVVITPSEMVKGKLQTCVDGSDLDLEKAGGVMFQSLVNKEDVNLGLQKFASENAGKVTNFKYPIMQNAFDTMQNLMLFHGFGVQLAVMASNQLKQSETAKKTNVKLEMGSIKGSTQFIDTKFIYEGNEDFKEYEIDVGKFEASKRPEAHLVLVHFLRLILKEICYEPETIKLYVRLSRKCPSTPSGSRIPDAKEFPQELFDLLFDYFLNYFNFNHCELDKPWSDDLQNLKWVQELGPNNRRPILFARLAQSRHNYITYTFETQFKSALADLRYGGMEMSKKGVLGWKMRKH